MPECERSDVVRRGEALPLQARHLRIMAQSRHDAGVRHDIDSSLVREFRRVRLSKPVAVRTMCARTDLTPTPALLRRDTPDDRTAADDNGLADRCRRAQAHGADEGRDQSCDRPARLRLFRWLLRLP